MAKTRQQLKDEFNAQLYLSASAFGMKSTGSPTVDRNIKIAANAVFGRVMPPLPHDRINITCVPDKEVFTPLKNILRGEDVEHYNRRNEKK